MDITSLLGQRLSLVDYLGQGKSSAFDAASQGVADKVTKIMSLVNTPTAETSGGVNVTLSAEAQALLSEGNGANDSKLSGVQKGAQNFMMSFFDQSGIDFSKLSDQALDLIQGLGDVVAGSGGISRDITTDAAESKYNDNRKVYTLMGANTRLRVAIDYGEDGKPVKLSVTDIANGQVETADITLEKQDGVQTMTISRTQREYQNGHMVKLSDIDPLSVDLYAKTEAA